MERVSCASRFVSPLLVGAGLQSQDAELCFFPRPCSHWCLAALSVVAWRLTLAQRQCLGGRALPACAELFCCKLGRCPIKAMPWLGLGISSHALSFPMDSVVVKGIFRENVTVPSSGAAVPQGSSRACCSDVAQKPKVSTLLVKEG